MIRTNEIKAQMKRLGETQKTLARKMKMSPSTLNRKINNANGEKITVEEALKIAAALEFQRTDLVGIFFATELAETQVETAEL